MDLFHPHDGAAVEDLPQALGAGEGQGEGEGYGEGRRTGAIDMEGIGIIIDGLDGGLAHETIDDPAADGRTDPRLEDRPQVQGPAVAERTAAIGGDFIVGEQENVHNSSFFGGPHKISVAPPYL